MKMNKKCMFLFGMLSLSLGIHGMQNNDNITIDIIENNTNTEEDIKPNINMLLEQAIQAHDEAIKALEILNEEKKTIENQLELLRAASEQNEETIQEKNNQIDQKNNELEELARQIENKNQQINELEHQLEISNEKFEILNQRNQNINELEIENNRLKEDTIRLQTNEEHMDIILEKINQENDFLQQEVNRLKQHTTNVWKSRKVVFVSSLITLGLTRSPFFTAITPLVVRHGFPLIENFISNNIISKIPPRVVNLTQDSMNVAGSIENFIAGPGKDFVITLFNKIKTALIKRKNQN